jgi:hypothetical protein
MDEPALRSEAKTQLGIGVYWLEQAVLALEDGTVFEGTSFGAPVERTGEVVFNTAITGYQEIFTDPSYCGGLRSYRVVQGQWL